MFKLKMGNVVKLTDDELKRDNLIAKGFALITTSEDKPFNEMSREELFVECERMGLRVPRNTRTDTLIAKLQGTGTFALGSITVTSTAGTNIGESNITVAESLIGDRMFVYKTGEIDAPVVSYDQDLSTWTELPGNGVIAPESGAVKITVAEVTPDTKRAVRSGSATLKIKAVVATAAIAGVTAPVTGAVPTASIGQTDEYTATIAWSPEAATFAADTEYTATITITPKAGYTLTGVTEDFFTVAGATTTNAADTGIVTAVFPRTAAA